MSKNFLRKSGTRSEHLFHEVGELLLPPAPVVRHVVAPEIHPAVNALLEENLCQTAVGGQHFVLPGPLSHADYDLAGVVAGDVGVVGRACPRGSPPEN